jgi:hypothetical protein
MKILFYGTVIIFLTMMVESVVVDCYKYISLQGRSDDMNGCIIYMNS